MFTMPSLWILAISTLVFFISAWYLNRFLNEQGIQKGFTRTVVVLVLASVTSSAVEAGFNRLEHALTKPVAQPAIPPSGDAAPVIKEAGQE
jgi:hypothetical protein